MTWGDVNLESRLIKLQVHQTKEHKRKRVPIPRLLVPILEKVGKFRSISTDRVFLTERGKPPSPDSLRKPWTKAVKAVGLDSAPRIHDLRHVWKTNAMRSGMDFEIRDTIMGHALKKKDVSRTYGRISDEDLIRAVDGMRFDHGETDIWVATATKTNPGGGNHQQP